MYQKVIALILVLVFACAPANAAEFTSEKAVKKEIQREFKNRDLKTKPIYLKIPLKKNPENPKAKSLNLYYSAIDDKGTGFPYDFMRVGVYKSVLTYHGVLCRGWDEYGITLYYFSYKLKPFLSLKHEKKIRKKAKTLGKKLKRKSRYKTVKNIHKYVMKRIKRYKSGQKNTYTAYYKRKANCVSYSCLFYLICREAKVPCKIIGGDNHCWNIVKLGKKWYHCDTTWDDCGWYPKYFLRGSKDFKGHKLNKRYKTKEFKKKYPIAKKKYKPKKGRKND